MFVDHTVFYDIWSLKENRNVIINWVSYPISASPPPRVSPKNLSSCVFLQTLGANFWSQATLGAILTRNFKDFVQIFSKSKLMGVLFHPLHPHLQYHYFS